MPASSQTPRNETRVPETSLTGEESGPVARCGKSRRPAGRRAIMYP